MFSGYEHDHEDVMQVPVPPGFSRDRPYAPEHEPPALSADDQGAFSPSYLGAFASIIQRIVPQPEEPLTQGSRDVGRELETVEEQEVATPGYGSPDWHDYLPSLRMPAASALGGTASGSDLSRPSENSGSAWSKNQWGWGSLFGAADNGAQREDLEGDVARYPVPDTSMASTARSDDRVGPPLTQVNNNEWGKHLWPAHDEPQDFAVGDKVLVNGRTGKVIWDGRPAHDFLMVIWQDDGTTSPAIPADDARLLEKASEEWPLRDQSGVSSGGWRWPRGKLKVPELKAPVSIRAISLPRLDWKLPAGEDKPSGVLGVPGYLLMGCVESYVRQVPGRCPCCCACIHMIILLVIIGVGMVVHPMEIETNFDAFMKTDTNSSTLSDTFTAAYLARSKSRRLQSGGTPLYRQQDVYIAYELRDATLGSIFSFKVFNDVVLLEKQLRQLPGWIKMCADSDFEFVLLCDPGVSLMNYMRPSLEIDTNYSIVPDKLTFDGRGRDVLPVESSLRLVEKMGLQKLVLPIGFDQADISGTQMFRSLFRFKIYCCTALEPQSTKTSMVNKIKADWNAFIKDELLPFLQKAAQDEELSVRVFFDGAGFEEIEVMQTLMGDNLLAAGSVSFVFVYLVFHTKSIFLSLAALIITLLSVPLSFVVFATVSGSTTLSIASFLSLFLVVGLGSDVVFVYTDFWRDSSRFKESEVDKLVWTMQHAGKASLATTATTALSFFANLASVLKPLREFGVFMGFCVVFVWVLITLIFLPLCAIDSRYFSRCRLRFGATDESEESSWQVGFRKLAEFIHHWRRLVLVIAFLIWVVSLICAAVQVETDSGVPNIFPDDHNQNRGKKVLEEFVSVNDVMDGEFNIPSKTMRVCSADRFGDSGVQCRLFWCEVESSIPLPREDANSCRCFRKPNPPCGVDATSAHVQMRIIGRASLNPDVATEHILGTDRSGLFGLNNLLQQTLSPVLLQEWETGKTQLKPIAEVEADLTRSTAQSSCGWQELCFCDSFVCKLPSTFNPFVDLSAGNGVRLLSSEFHEDATGGRVERRLDDAPGESATLAPWRRMDATSQVASAQRAGVKVVFGIQAEGIVKLLGEPKDEDRWSFLEYFNMQQPWGQRNLYSFCTNTPAYLKVAQQSCWIEDFRTWLLQPPRQERFPVAEARFEGLVNEFLANGLTGMVSSSDFLWIRGSTIRGCFVEFAVDVHKYVETQSALKYKQLWDNHLDQWNLEASRFARGAWHTSSLWVRAEAQDALISSTVMTLILVVGLAFLGMLAFTVDVILSLFVVVTTLSVLTSLAFFIISVMAWPIGPVEVIALIVFIGYAVTYSLHIAHKYGSRDALTHTHARLELGASTATRFQRTEYALQAIGSAAIGSACTTIGCSIFLLCCTLTIFQKLGGVVLAVTMMSILTALFPLPAMLFCAGPLRPGECSTIAYVFDAFYDLFLWFWPTRLPEPSGGYSPKAHGHLPPPKPSTLDEDSRPSPVREIVLAPSPSRGAERTAKQVVQPLGGRGTSPQPPGRMLPPSPSDGAPSLASFGLPSLTAPQLTRPVSNDSDLGVNDVKLSEQAYDIGEETCVAPIRVRKEDHSNVGKVRNNRQSGTRMQVHAKSRPKKLRGI